MSRRRTLLAHISPRLSSGEENLATEALCFVLNQSPTTRKGFIDFLARVLNRQLPDMSFRTQAGHSDGTIPDLVGIDSTGRPTVYIESKFWAGLTDSQPVGYLKRLQREGGSGLVIVAPENRLGTLWPTLVERCGPNDPTRPGCHEAADHRRLEADSLPPLVLTGWNAVLQNLLHAATTAGDIAASEDLRQIKGLCDNMEDAGFLPLRLEELTGNVPRRILDYCGLVDDLMSSLDTQRLVDIKRLKASGGSGYYGRWIRLKGNGARISWDARLWAKVHPTPLWLQVLGPAFKPSAAVLDALAPWISTDPPRAFVGVDDTGGVFVPLILPTAHERHLVLQSLVDQVRSVYDLVPEVLTALGTDAESATDPPQEPEQLPRA